MENRVISFHYTLKNLAGQVLDSSIGNQPMLYLEGKSQIIPGLETALAPLQVGDKKAITISAADAYGQRDEKLLVTVPRSQLPQGEVKVGDYFQVSMEQDARVVIVVAIKDTEVTLDGNHPLAGQDLCFDIEVIDIRPATLEELKHGHAHGPGEHHH